MSRPSGSALAKAMFERDGYRCRHCHRPGVPLGDITPGQVAAGLVPLTRDHVRPRSKGGKTKLSNLQTLCKLCNEAKGDAWRPTPPLQSRPEPEPEVDVSGDVQPAPQSKEWIIDRIDPETGEIDRGAVIESLHDCEAICHREGGMFIIAPIKQEILDQETGAKFYVVRGWIFKHSFLPPVRQTQRSAAALAGAQSAEAEAELELEPEPVHVTA